MNNYYFFAWAKFLLILVSYTFLFVDYGFLESTVSLTSIDFDLLHRFEKEFKLLAHDAMVSIFFIAS